jgi:hypothetical protein
MRLLDARGLQIFEDHFGEARRFGSLLTGINQRVIFIDGEDAMRGKALDGEGSGDAHLLVVFVGLVIEIFRIGFGGDRGVDFLLAGDALLPPLGVELFGVGGPGGLGFARDLPFFPGLFEGFVEGFAQGF